MGERRASKSCCMLRGKHCMINISPADALMILMRGWCTYTHSHVFEMFEMFPCACINFSLCDANYMETFLAVTYNCKV